jgi:hypothetical protein
LKFDSARAKLGKLPYHPDERTFFLSNYIREEIHVPGAFNFDRHRRPLPHRSWGNGLWNNSVIASQANQLLRFERIEQRQTIVLADSDAISRYKQFTGSVAPEDTRDTGTTVLDVFRNWRNQGWTLTTKAGVEKNYKIDAYGELEPNDQAGLRAACYTMHGIHIGFWLPLAAIDMAYEGYWRVRGESGPQWEPGTWGGLLAYARAYDPDGFEILAWGTPIWVSNQFIERYADEVWAVVASFMDWRASQAIDVPAIQSKQFEISKG